MGIVTVHGLLLCLRIVDRGAKLDVSEIRPAEPLRYTKSIRVGMAARIKPALVVETDRFDHKRVAFPLAH